MITYSFKLFDGKMIDSYRIITKKGLEKQYLIDGKEVISSVEEPVSSIEPSIVEVLRRQTINKPVLVGYDNTITLLSGINDRFPNVSMTHFFLADTLSGNKDVRKARSLADLGCGAGFSGNYAAKNFEGLQEGRIIFGDLFPESITAALNAYLINNELDPRQLEIRQDEKSISVRGNEDQTIEFRVGDVMRTMYGETVEVAVASPIYIPEICEVFPQAFELFGRVSKSIGADFYVAHSSLADKVVEEAALQTGARLIDIRSGSFQLDLSVTDWRRNQLDEESIERLLTKGLVIEGSGKNIQYRHELRVSKMSYR